MINVYFGFESISSKSHSTINFAAEANIQFSIIFKQGQYWSRPGGHGPDTWPTPAAARRAGAGTQPKPSAARWAGVDTPPTPVAARWAGADKRPIPVAAQWAGEDTRPTPGAAR